MATITKAPRAFRSFTCHTCRQRLLPLAPPAAIQQQQRAFSSSPPTNVDVVDTLARASRDPAVRNQKKSAIENLLDGPYSDAVINAQFDDQVSGSQNGPHRLHVYATKHNTHLTFVQPPKSAAQTASSGISGTSASSKDQKKMVDVLLSLSTGNLGFRKAGRGSYDAAYQLAAFALKQMTEKGMLRDMHSLQVVLRGFGAGREAVSKVILGSEGRYIRGRITSWVDATRLKQGGPRGKKPRRLG